MTQSRPEPKVIVIPAKEEDEVRRLLGKDE